MQVRDIGILPFLVSFPFMFYPRIVDGDTQPWVIAAALIALVTFRTDRFMKRRDIVLAVLALLAIVAYAVRAESGFLLLRHAYIYLAFITFWVICQRENGDYFPFAVRITVLIWFLVGLYQYLLVQFGYQLETSLRYIEGRSGVPSLTAEASYYGSLSMVHLMYLLSLKDARNRIYIACAVASVILSGSVLAFILLVFPLWKLRGRIRVAVLASASLLVVGEYYISSAGVAARLSQITSDGLGLGSVLLDPSASLRAGHLYFTLVENLIPSLLLTSPINFMEQYNQFAHGTGVLIETESQYILPAIGEMVYGAGIFGVLLLGAFLKRAQDNCSSRGVKLEKIAFILACMMNPITIANIFLIIYAQARD